MSYKRISARTILGLSIENCWTHLAGPFIIVFDDGTEVLTNHKEAIYSRYYWTFHEHFPDFKLTKRHYVNHVLKGGRVSMKTHIELLENILWDCVDYLGTIHTMQEMVEIRYQLAQLAYESSNRHYNDMSTELEEYVTSLDILDFHQVFKDADLVEAYERAKPDDESVQDIYYTLDWILRKKADLQRNMISKLYRSSLVNKQQVQQCLGVRGFVTDINNDRFGIPVMRGYYQGLRGIRDYMIEISTSTKSLNASKGQLQDTEYFSRKLQLMDMQIENLHYEDCGTQSYLEWKVRGKSDVHEGDGDMPILVGKYMLNEETGQLHIITPEDNFVGQTIKLRSTFRCQHPDPLGVCAVCYGRMSEQIPPNSNIGHANCTHVTEKNAQGVLSTKHLDSSTSIKGVILDELYRRYIRTGSNENCFVMSDDIKIAGKAGRVFLRVDIDCAPTLEDVRRADRISSLVESRMSEILEVEVQVDDMSTPIPVRHGKRIAYFTYEFLDYIKEYGYTVDEETNQYVFDMRHWKWNVPFISLPMRHFNMSDHSKDIAQVLESTVKELVERDRLIDPAATLVELCTLINSKTKVNLAVIEITLLGAMIRSAETFEYALPKPWTQSGLGVMKYTLLHRSLAAYMAYEHHAEAIYSPESYVLKNRPEHVMDGILMPYEVFEQGHRQR